MINLLLEGLINVQYRGIFLLVSYIVTRTTCSPKYGSCPTILHTKPSNKIYLFINSKNKPRSLYFSKSLFERLVFGGTYIWREICASKSTGLAYTWKEIYVSNLPKGFTEIRLEDVDLSKTHPCKYFFYMDRGNPSQN